MGREPTLTMGASSSLPPSPFSLSVRGFCLMRGSHSLLPSSLAPGSSQVESRPAKLGPDASVTASCWQELLELFSGAAGLGRGLVEMTPEAPRVMREGSRATRPACWGCTFTSHYSPYYATQWAELMGIGSLFFA